MSTLPKKLGPRHKLAAAFLLSGARPGEVARQLGWHVSTIAHLQQAPAFVAELQKGLQELRARLTQATTQQFVGTPQHCPRCGADLQRP